MTEHIPMLSTIDNPFDPHTEFDRWWHYDVLHGHNSSNLLGRIAKTSSDLPESFLVSEISSAIDEIIAHDEQGIYIKVSKPGQIGRQAELSS